MKITNVEILGMPQERLTHKSCEADFGVGDDFATLYHIRSLEENKGHATELLTEAKKHYESLGKKFGGTYALTSRMKSIYDKLGIEEYTEI